ncbi:CAP domain-containing protein [Pseudanabaena sp. PCC 6802]|uniref:CAP domain-containing protein n=1 Tax=Pseudanabaena sp. PCC 6802 TaxID=118173 RepID=UPI00034C3611|nr:CAP domain-containing protein [Pseudanabaena sp. PCC 6802]
MSQKLQKLTIFVISLASGLSNIWIPSAIAQSPHLPDRAIAQTDDSIAIERAIHNRINQYRSRNGLSPLRLDERLSQMARSHSEAMADRRVAFGHQGFERRRKAVQKMMEYSDIAENVAYSGGIQRPTQQAVEVWLNSSSHRANIEGQYDTTGIGVALSPNGRYYFTQIFVKRR